MVDEIAGPAPRVDLAQSTALKSPDFQATARAFHACAMRYQHAAQGRDQEIAAALSR